MGLRSYLTAVWLGLLTAHAWAALDLTFGDDSDLSRFVTRPEIRAPRMTVHHYDKGRVEPGFFFVAPYAEVYQQPPALNHYQPCQTGPHIYDSDGNLIWSGACQFRNKNFADFRPTKNSNGSYGLSAIDIGLRVDDHSPFGDGESRGRGLILDDAYRELHAVEVPKAIDSFNMHEFKVVGTSALHLLWKPEYIDVSELGLERKAGWVGNMGFREVDVESGKTLFEWWSFGHIPLAESTWPVDGIEGPTPVAWDYLHLDSVDKSPDGDYLISARHTDCIYKVSGQDHSVRWRLGGKFSSFALNAVTFARQHDARFIEPRMLQVPDEAAIEYVSLVDNAADDYETFQNSSSVLVFKLDLASKTAQPVRRVGRPDGSTTMFSGNAQILSNGNTFASWSGNSYASEHTSEGDLVSEIEFHSHRFSSYRTYKADWEATPSDRELAIKCFAHGISEERATTACYVSWNGATQVKSWRFQSGAPGDSIVMGTVEKDGFETGLHSQGYSGAIFVEALDSEGSVLTRSKATNVARPEHWTLE